MNKTEIQLLSSRIFAIAITFIFFFILPDVEWFKIYIPYIFAHYLISFMMSTKKDVRENNYLTLSLGLLITVGIVLPASNYAVEFLVFFFGIHSILTDIYIQKIFNLKQSSQLILARFFLNLSIYLSMITNQRHIVEMVSLDRIYFLPLIFVAIGYLFFVAKKNKERFPNFDIPMIIAGIIICFTDIKIELPHVVFYHVTLWMFLPFIIHKKKALLPIGLYLTSFAGFYYLKAWMVYFSHVKVHFFLGYFHVIHSFFSSTLNPEFINNFAKFNFLRSKKI